MAKLVVFILLVAIFSHNTEATVNEFLRKGELTLQNLADIKLATLRLIQEFMTGKPSGLGSYRLHDGTLLNRPIVIPGEYAYQASINGQIARPFGIGPPRGPMGPPPPPGGAGAGFSAYGQLPLGGSYGVRPGGGYIMNSRQSAGTEINVDINGQSIGQGQGQAQGQVQGQGQGPDSSTSVSKSVTFNWLDPSTWLAAFLPGHSSEFSWFFNLDPNIWTTLLKSAFTFLG